MRKKKNIYPAYAEAQTAAQALGIKNSKEYKKRCKEDPRLPWSPDQSYADKGWIDWYDFLGNERPDFYPAYAEAQTAAQALGIKIETEYRKRCKEDPRLPASPPQFYAEKGWIDWYDFLGNQRPDFYASYAEAQAAAQALGVNTLPEYTKRSKEDPRLPTNPSRFYAGNGWIDWYDFLGNDPEYLPSDFPKYVEIANQWLKTQDAIPIKKHAIKYFLENFARPLGLPGDPLFLLWRSNKIDAEAYRAFIESRKESQKKRIHFCIAAFFQWILDEHCTDDDEDERVVLPDFRNPFTTILAGFGDSIDSYRPSQTVKPPLGYEYILRAKSFLTPEGEQPLNKMPHLQEFFDADWVDIDPSLIDQNDPNCVWRVKDDADRIIDGVRIPRTTVHQIWSPVRFIALFTLLRVPLRGQQILWLDSGEADAIIAMRHPDGKIRWETNTGPLAGRGTHKKDKPQAVVKRGDDDQPGMYITTNKTGRRAGSYSVEWIPEDLAYWLLLLRDWQSKYQPLVEPTAWTNIKTRVEINEAVLKRRGTQCFLFRTDSSGNPMQTTTAFTHTLPALLAKIQRDGEKLAFLSDKTKKQNRWESIYTPHCLRVSLITAYINDGDAPIPVIATLVGHASLVMTIYYNKLNNEQMRRPMAEAEKRAAQLAAQREAEAIRLHGLRGVQSPLIVTDGNRALIDANLPGTSCVVMDCGVCPMGGAACHEGGAPVVERKTETHYAAVEAGYLGQQNCVRCRFFVTGPAFLGGLVSLVNEISLEIYSEATRYGQFTDEVNALDNASYDATTANQPFLLEDDRRRAVANQQQSATKMNMLLEDYAAIYKYIKQCRDLIRNGNQQQDKGVLLISANDAFDVEIGFDDQSNYHLLAEICQNAEIYRSANPQRALPLISQAIDRMAENNGLRPAMFLLEDDEKLAVVNEFNRFLLERLGSWERIDKLVCGEVSLLDLDGDDHQLDPITTQVRTILSRAAPTLRKETVHD